MAHVEAHTDTHTALHVELAVAGPWMMSKLVDYIQQVLQSIPSVVG